MTICYIASNTAIPSLKNTAANLAGVWDICRVEDLAGHCELVAQPIIFGLRTEQAYEYVAHLNDDLAWAKEVRK